MRRLLKYIHPEGIPWPGTIIYNAISSKVVFQRHYEMVAKDILRYCKTTDSLLDIGTGPGWLLLKLYQQSPAMRLVGIDVSASMVGKAQENLAAAGLSKVIEIREGNAVSLPFAGNFFDIVVSTGSIHHWKDPTAALNDIYRVLKPGGYAIIYDLVSDTPACALAEMKREFGNLNTVMFWIHGFEEPFYSRTDYETLPQVTLFKEGLVQFVGVLCRLIMKKG
jgi:ubiquinone/menaquinone biosynthesis C-methylase UbiE